MSNLKASVIWDSRSQNECICRNSVTMENCVICLQVGSIEINIKIMNITQNYIKREYISLVWHVMALSAEWSNECLVLKDMQVHEQITATIYQFYKLLPRSKDIHGHLSSIRRVPFSLLLHAPLPMLCSAALHLWAPDLHVDSLTPYSFSCTRSRTTLSDSYPFQQTKC